MSVSSPLADVRRARAGSGSATDGRTSSWRLYGLAAALIATTWLVTYVSTPLDFDDSYMFWRYAVHMTQGLGIAWNPDGLQTYGMTGHLWMWVLLPFTALPLDAGTSLRLASGLTGAAALAVMALVVTRHAMAGPFGDVRVALAAVSLPLLANPDFTYQLQTGMDTMLSMLLHTLLILLTLRYAGGPSLGRAVLVGLAAFAAILTRPDNGLCALGFPFLAFWLLTRERRLIDLGGLVVLPLALIAVELAVCTLVFGTPLPLSFYAKSLGIYDGFLNPESAAWYLLLACVAALPFLTAWLLARMEADVRFAAAFLLPLALTFAYLLTVRQVMGESGRYYMPFLPYIVVPALLTLARALAREGGVDGMEPRLRKALAGLAVVAVCFFPLAGPLETRLTGAAAAAHEAQRANPIRGPRPLGQLAWKDAIKTFADVVVRPLPAGAVVAASEVGYLGHTAPDVHIIDLVGLNDTRIARQGFSMDDLLARKPDLIWLPHLEYVGLRAKILKDARLFEDYVVIAEAFNYGIAVRRDSRHRPLIDRNVATAWRKLYSNRDLARYVVTGTKSATARFPDK